MTIYSFYVADYDAGQICERFEREGNTIKKVATPRFTGKWHHIAYPGSRVIKEVQNYGEDGLTFLFTVEQSPAFLLTQIFPDGVMVDDQHIELSKPFLLENKGGEYIKVNLNNITSTEIINVNLSTTKPLVVAETRDLFGEKYRRAYTRYREVPYTYFNGYDDSKSLRENSKDGVFDSLFQIETAPFYVNYTQKLYTPQVWKRGTNRAVYSRYCILEPEIKVFKYSTMIRLWPTSSDPTRITVDESEYTTRDIVQAFSSIYY